jgi:hypothetical protein
MSHYLQVAAGTGNEVFKGKKKHLGRNRAEILSPLTFRKCNPVER